MRKPVSFRILGALTALFLLLPGTLFAAAPSNEELLKKIETLETEVKDLKQQLSTTQTTATEAKKTAESAAETKEIAGAEKAAAAEPTGALAKAKDFFGKTEIHAFASAAYEFNARTPNNQMNVGRAFDFNANSFTLDTAELSILKNVSKPGDIGFRTDLNAGFSIPEVTHATDVANGLNQPENFDLQQAYVTYDIPVANGLVTDFGKMITPFGYEVIEGWDGFNDNYSHSFLFTYAIPFTHTGLRTTYNFTDHIYLMAMVCNGWDLVRDNNKGKTVCTQLAFDITKDIRMWAGYSIGPEQKNDSSHMRQLVDATIQWKVTPKLTLTANGDFGHETNVPQFGSVTTINSTTVGGVTANDAVTSTVQTGTLTGNWGGLAGYARYQFNDWLAFIARSEFFIDDNGTRTGLDQDLWEITATLETKILNNFVVRPEYRHDQSDKKFFNGDKAQDTIGVNALYYF